MSIKICDSNPECACQQSLPGDATCLSPEQLAKWCEEQVNSLELPQCNLEK